MLNRWLGMYGHNLAINPGMEYFLDDLELFRSSVRIQANKQRIYTDEDDNVTRVFDGAGFEEDQCLIIGFVDTNLYPTTRCGSGPAGQKGSDRKRLWQERQQAIFSNYGKMHGVKLLSLVLPNGITLCYGPVSVRRNDNRVLDWSEADEYLHQLFQANVIPDNAFAFYGDSIFVGPRRYFRSKMVPLVAGMPLPE